MADAFDAVGFEFVSYIIYFCAFFGITAACFTNLIVSKYYSTDELFFLLTVILIEPTKVAVSPG